MLKVFTGRDLETRTMQALDGHPEQFEVRPLAFLGWVQHLQQLGIDAQSYHAHFDYGIVDNDSGFRAGSFLDVRPSKIVKENGVLKLLPCAEDEDELLMLIDLIGLGKTRVVNYYHCEVVEPRPSGILKRLNLPFMVVRGDTDLAWIKVRGQNSDTDNFYSWQLDRQVETFKGQGVYLNESELSRRLTRAYRLREEEGESVAARHEAQKKVLELIQEQEQDMTSFSLEMTAEDPAYFYLRRGASCWRFMFLLEPKVGHGIKDAKEFLRAQDQGKRLYDRDIAMSELSSLRRENEKIRKQLEGDYAIWYLQAKRQGEDQGLPSQITRRRVLSHPTRKEFTWVITKEGALREPDFEYSPLGVRPQPTDPFGREAEFAFWRQILPGEVVATYNEVNGPELSLEVEPENVTEEQKLVLKQLVKMLKLIDIFTLSDE